MGKIIVNIVFRVDATKKNGLGHFMRCYALAEELVRRDNKCIFLSNIEDKQLFEKISSSEISFEKVNTSPSNKHDLDYLVNFSKNNCIDWIITDSYDITSDYLRILKKFNFRILSIDDTSQIDYPSDIVVNQNVNADKLQFNGDVETSFLLGPKYIMLRDELLQREKKKYRDEVSKILITFGSIDYDNLTIKMIRSLDGIIDRNLELLVVLGPLNESDENFKQKINNLNYNIRLISSPSDMTDLYLESDIAISAGGSSCYELAYFGIPNIIITIANNQLNIARGLDKKHVSFYLGNKENISPNELRKALKKLILNNSLRKEMSNKGKKLVDGNGKSRTVDFMFHR